MQVKHFTIPVLSGAGADCKLPAQISRMGMADVFCGGGYGRNFRFFIPRKTKI